MQNSSCSMLPNCRHSEQDVHCARVARWYHNKASMGNLQYAAAHFEPPGLLQNLCAEVREQNQGAGFRCKQWYNCWCRPEYQSRSDVLVHNSMCRHDSAQSMCRIGSTGLQCRSDAQISCAAQYSAATVQNGCGELMCRNDGAA